MMPRVAGASLALLAFAIVLVGGLFTQNSVTLTLSRGILALFLFFFIGLVLGTAAQRVVREYERNCQEELNSRRAAGAEGSAAASAQPHSTGISGTSVAT